MIIEKTINELTVFLRKTGRTLYELSFFPTRVFQHLQLQNNSRYIKSKILFLISCFCYLIIQTSHLNEKNIESRTYFNSIFTSAKLQGNITELEKFFFLILVFLMVYLIIVLLSKLYGFTHSEARLFHDILFYYASLNLFVYQLLYVASVFYYDKLSIILFNAHLINLDWYGRLQNTNRSLTMALPYIIVPGIYLIAITKNLFSNKKLYYKYLITLILLLFSVDYVHRIYRYSFAAIYSSSSEKVILKNTITFSPDDYEIINDVFFPELIIDTTKNDTCVTLNTYIYNQSEDLIMIPKANPLIIRKATDDEAEALRNGAIVATDFNSFFYKEKFVFKAAELETKSNYMIVKPGEIKSIDFKYIAGTDSHFKNIDNFLASQPIGIVRFTFFTPSVTNIVRPQSWVIHDICQPLQLGKLSRENIIKTIYFK